MTGHYRHIGGIIAPMGGGSMKDASRETKQKWNAAHYTQIKVSANPVIAAAFKDACARNGVSMAHELSAFMESYSYNKPMKVIGRVRFATRQQRRASVKYAISLLEEAMQKELDYHDRFPSNLEGSPLYEASEQSAAVIGEAIELLESAFE